VFFVGGVGEDLKLGDLFGVEDGEGVFLWGEDLREVDFGEAEGFGEEVIELDRFSEAVFADQGIEGEGFGVFLLLEEFVGSIFGEEAGFSQELCQLARRHV